MHHLFSRLAILSEFIRQEFARTSQAKVAIEVVVEFPTRALAYQVRSYLADFGFDVTLMHFQLKVHLPDTRKVAYTTLYEYVILATAYHSGESMMPLIIQFDGVSIDIDLDDAVHQQIADRLFRIHGVAS